MSTVCFCFIFILQTLACLKPSGEQSEIKIKPEVEYKAFSKMHYSPNGQCAYMVAGGPRIFTKLIKVHVKSGETSVIRASHSAAVDTAYYSFPEEKTWDTTDGAKAYGYYYPPLVIVTPVDLDRSVSIFNGLKWVLTKCEQASHVIHSG